VGDVSDGAGGILCMESAFEVFRDRNCKTDLLFWNRAGEGVAAIEEEERGEEEEIDIGEEEDDDAATMDATGGSVVEVVERNDALPD
jgi:hypothetical protein